MIPFFSRMFPGTNLQDLNLDWICRRIMELSNGIIAPWINPENQDWMVYDTETEQFVDSGVSAAGGGYVKPETGIPKTDLSPDVQASLDKADTALQSVPDTYRTAAAQDVIDNALSAAITSLQNSQQYHAGDTFTINSGLCLMAYASSSGEAGGGVINLPKEIGSDVSSCTWAGAINFWAEKDHPAGITGLTITGIAKTSACNLALNFSFPSGTSVPSRALGFLNMNNLTITFN